MLPLLDSGGVLSEDELVALVRQGDRSAFNHIISQHIDVLLRIAYGYVKSRADAEDIIQDILLSTWRNRTTWQPHGSIGSYFAVAVRRRAFNVIKHRRVEAKYSERIALEAAHEITLFNSVAADTAMCEQEEEASTWQLLERLSDKAKMVLLLRYGQQLSFSDVATAMGISVPAARQLAKRALDQLRAIYKV